MPSHAETPEKDTGRLAIVGLGPGKKEYMTGRALAVIAESEIVLGHATYLEPIKSLLEGKQVISSSMGKEVDRATQAIDLAKTRKVAIVSGGDPGIYGMASIVLEVLEHDGAGIDVEVVPGVTAATAAASLLGSPLSGDYATLSLSDLLTPLEVIEKRLDTVFTIGIPVVLYNPKSRGRPHNFAIAVSHARHHLAGTTPVAIVKNALREGEQRIITTLEEIEDHESEIDMHSVVLIGGTESRIWRRGDDVKGIITPRGYHKKYVY